MKSSVVALQILGIRRAPHALHRSPPAAVLLEVLVKHVRLFRCGCDGGQR